MSCRSHTVRLLAAAFFVCALAVPAAAFAETYYRIEPGPKKISEEERAIVEDPALGIEGAVILVEETDLDESDPSYPKTTYHLRAKILSNAGQSLAQVEIPYSPAEGYMIRWWARTLCPDGPMQELRLDDLEAVPFEKGESFEYLVRRGTLKGVAPGCVIDYGYSVRNLKWSWERRVPLLKPWPVRRFRYRWLPSPYGKSDHRIDGADGLPITATRNRGLLTLAGTDLPRLPAGTVLGPAIVLSYSKEEKQLPEVRKSLARGLALAARRFAEGKESEDAVAAAVASLDLPEDADLGTRVGAAYAWLSGGFTVTALRSSEYIRAGTAGAEWLQGIPAGGAGRILAAREASPREMDYIFAALARAVGAEAHLVLATDRRAGAGNVSDRRDSVGHDETVVAVHKPGDPDEKAAFADPGSGLPYGELPWWLTPTRGLLATEEGGREILLPPSKPKSNVVETRVTIGFPETGGGASVLWSRSAKGQWGLSDDPRLRTLTADERAGRLAEMCGAGAGLDVVRSEGPEFVDRRAGYRLACEGRSPAPGPTTDEAQFEVGFGGAWIEPLPETVSTVATEPFLFQFPRVELLTAEVMSPAGFSPGHAPPPVRLETPFARYSLTVTTTSTGHRVRRDLSLLSAIVYPEERETLRKFLEDVRSADATLLTFRRAEGPPS